MWWFDGRPALHAGRRPHAERAPALSVGARRAAAALALAALLGACGFTLRGTQTLPYASMALNFPENSPLAAELARSIRTSTSTAVVADPAAAASVLDLLGEIKDRQVLTINAQGRVIEYSLRERVRFRLRDGRGREVIEATELSAQRDISYNDSLRLAKESEEILLYQDMQSDLVQQILRRVAAARPYAADD